MLFPWYKVELNSNIHPIKHFNFSLNQVQRYICWFALPSCLSAEKINKGDRLGSRFTAAPVDFKIRLAISFYAKCRHFCNYLQEKAEYL